uniref:Putative FAD-depending monooxygenase n=1 Tax=Streptomyces tendae TaxID=1932 RepID=A7DWK0_STRTE|nr:putative FAD-depending monooxygenase [Streptomyces tendae]
MASYPERHAVVVGAGIGGLAAAVALVRVGWHVTVYERAPELRTEGAGISLLSNAVRSLDRLGAGDAVRAAAAVMLPGGEGVRTPSGRRLMKPADPSFVSRHGLSTLVLPRPALHRALYDALPADCVRTGTEVLRLAGPPAGPVEVSCRDAAGEHTVPAGLVVAADGTHSRIRRALWPAVAAPAYSGHSVWRGIARLDRSEPGGTTWGCGQEFGRMPLRDGRVYWYAVANTPPGRRHPDELAEVVRRFGTWHHPIPALLRATPADEVLHHDVFELAQPLPGYAKGVTALLGDAAHAMTSDLGQGACQALEDAVVLGAELAADSDVPTALARYDAQRRPRAQTVVEASRRMGRLKLRERWWDVLMRNALISVMPPRAGEKAMARIGDWHPPALPAREAP